MSRRKSARARAASSTPLAVLVVVRGAQEVQVGGGHVGPEVVVALAGAPPPRPRPRSLGARRARARSLWRRASAAGCPRARPHCRARRSRRRTKSSRSTGTPGRASSLHAARNKEHSQIRQSPSHSRSHSSSHKCFAYYSYKS